MCGAGGTYGGEKSNICGFVAETPKERAHLEDLGIDGRVLLKLILKKYERRQGLDSSGLGQ
jgi:hypothetical protein